MALTIGEYFEAIQAAPPDERWKVAGALSKRMCNHDRVLAATCVADFIYAMAEPEILPKTPKGMKF